MLNSRSLIQIFDDMQIADCMPELERNARASALFDELSKKIVSEATMKKMPMKPMKKMPGKGGKPCK